MSSNFVSSKANWIKNYGDPITIIRSSGNVPTTGRLMAMKRRTGFFSINYLREALFAPDSGIQRGDLIRDEATSELFFVEGYQVKTRGGVASSIDVELYAVNYESVQIQRLTPMYDNNLNSTGEDWSIIDNLPMNVEHVNGDVRYHDGLLMPETVFRLTLQTTDNLLLEDRVYIDDKPYMVTDINLSVIPGLLVAQAKVDMR